jgi:nitroreductase
MKGFDLEQVDHLLTTTRAVRRRLDLDRPVEPEVIAECLRLALQAPNAANSQKWRWLVVTDPETRRAIGDLYREVVLPAVTKMRENRLREGDVDRARISNSTVYLAENLGRVPVHVIACIESRLYKNYAATLTQGQTAALYGSIYPAVWSFQLALRSRGLGSVFTTAHIHRAEQVAELLGIPDGYTQTCLIPVAYTQGDDFTPAKRQPLEEVVFAERWGVPFRANAAGERAVQAP